MPRPGITVTTSAAAVSATPGQRIATWFVAAQTERGPSVPDRPSPLRSLADYTALYGTRNATLGSVAQTYDMLDAFWRAGGGQHPRLWGPPGDHRDTERLLNAVVLL